MLTDETENDLKARLAAQTEWLLIRSNGETFALLNTEIEIEPANNKLLFSFLDDKGFRCRRVSDCVFKGDEIVLHLTGNFKKDYEKVRLVSRVSIAQLSAELETARLEKANRIAALIAESYPPLKIVRVELNKENGRFGQIVAEKLNGEQIAVLTDVSDALTPEVLLSTAILWLSKIANRKKKPIENIWIISESKSAESLRKMHALIRENWKKKIFIKEISRKDAKSQKENEKQSESDLNDSPVLAIEDLWHEKAKAIRITESPEISRIAHEIVELAPDEIDVVSSKNGETLRFLGLPFCVCEKLSTKKKYGTEQKKIERF